MTTLLDVAADHEERIRDEDRPDAAERLRSETAAVRLHVRWPGLSRALPGHQKAAAAAPFAADQKALSAGKRLFDTAHPAFRAVTAVKTKAVSHWRDNTLPFVEPGVRLLPRGDVAAFEGRLAALAGELAAAAAGLDRRREELLAVARRRLGALFDPADYPATLAPLFGLSWDWPSVEPPDYLARLSPRVYEAECRRVSARFEEAVTLAERAFAAELAQLVEHLAERLSGSEDGKPRIFRDSAVENLTEFFRRFRRLSLGSDERLDELVERAHRVIRGVSPRGLRESVSLKAEVARGLAEVRTSLDGLLVGRPRRAILRRPK